MTPMIPSNRDLAFDGNLTQARYELYKAIDQGGEAEQAAWSRNWGEAALSRSEAATDAEDGWDFFGPSDSLVEAAEEAQETANNLAATLSGEKPDLVLARQRMTALSNLIAIINTKLEASES